MTSSRLSIVSQRIYKLIIALYSSGDALRHDYSLCPSNLRMIVSMNVFCGATCPRRIGIVNVRPSVRQRTADRPDVDDRRRPNTVMLVNSVQVGVKLPSLNARRFRHISTPWVQCSHTPAMAAATNTPHLQLRHRQQQQHPQQQKQSNGHSGAPAAG